MLMAHGRGAPIPALLFNRQPPVVPSSMRVAVDHRQVKRVAESHLRLLAVAEDKLKLWYGG